GPSLSNRVHCVWRLLCMRHVLQLAAPGHIFGTIDCCSYFCQWLTSSRHRSDRPLSWECRSGRYRPRALWLVVFFSGDLFVDHHRIIFPRKDTIYCSRRLPRISTWNFKEGDCRSLSFGSRCSFYSRRGRCARLHASGSIGCSRSSLGCST